MTLTRPVQKLVATVETMTNTVQIHVTTLEVPVNIVRYVPVQSTHTTALGHVILLVTTVLHVPTNNILCVENLSNAYIQT